MDLTYAVIEVSPGGVVSWLVMGLIAGWIAGVAMKRGGGGLGDLVMGMIGSFLGGLLIACVVEGPAQFWGSIVVAFIGACVLIGLLRFVSSRETALRLRRYGCDGLPAVGSNLRR